MKAVVTHLVLITDRVVWGHQSIRNLSIGEELPCERVGGNEKEPHAVAVWQRNTTVDSVSLGKYQLLILCLMSKLSLSSKMHEQIRIILAS